MSGTPALPPMLRVGYLQHDILQSIRTRRAKQLGRAFASFAFPARWPAPQATRANVQDAALARGSLEAARVAAHELATEPAAHRPSTPAALRRAKALDLVAGGLPVPQQRIEQTVAAFLRGELAPPADPDVARAPDTEAIAPDAEARAAADGLRREGHNGPVIVATFPGFDPNPYGALMELAYRPRGVAAVHVDGPDGVEAIVHAAADAGYRAVVHLNAPDRFVGRPETDIEATDAAAASLRTIDSWIDRGASIVYSVHNGPRLSGRRQIGERIVAQGIADRAATIHVLSPSTAARLANWISLDPARVVVIRHPRYDSVLGPLPDRAEARVRLGLGAKDEGSEEPVVIGLVGSLVDRKGGLGLLDAFALAPRQLADGRPLRLLLAGSPSGAGAEDLIRRALADDRVVARFGYIEDAELPQLLAALDVAVVPYGQLLNSGWLHLALTAGVPVIGPAGSTAEEIVDPAALATYPDDGPEALAAALAGAGALVSPEARAAARRSVAGLDPQMLSEQFVDVLLERAG